MVALLPDAVFSRNVFKFYTIYFAAVCTSLLRILSWHNACSLCGECPDLMICC